MSGSGNFPGSRPGADTRLWLTLGVVKALGWDPEAAAGLTGGVFADVQFVPTGELETCYVGMPYAGAGFGAWWPLEVDDTVLVGVPGGDTGWGPVILTRFWNSGDLPPNLQDLDWLPKAAQLEPPTDAVIRLKDGAAYKLRTRGGDISIQVEGTGDVTIENLGTGKVKLGLAATAVPVALSPLVEAAIIAAVNAGITAHTHAVAALGTSSPGAGAITTTLSTAATKTEAT